MTDNTMTAFDAFFAQDYETIGQALRSINRDVFERPFLEKW